MGVLSSCPLFALKHFPEYHVRQLKWSIFSYFFFFFFFGFGVAMNDLMHDVEAIHSLC